MISRRGNQSSAALGLYGSKDAWRLVKVDREDERFRITGKYTAARLGGGDDRAEIESLLNQLPNEDRGLPIGLVLADGVGLYRRISAPKADDAVIDKIVAAQVETMLPGRAEDVRLGWSRAGSGDALWVHAVARSEIDEALSILPPGTQAAAIISDTMAVARLVLAGNQASRGTRLFLAVGEVRSAFILTADSELKHVSSFDGGYATINDEGATDWSQQLSDTRNELLGSVPPDQRPKRCECLAPPSVRQRVIESAEQALDMPIDICRCSGDTSGMDTNDTAQMIAASAAAACINPVTPTIRLSAGLESGEQGNRLKRYAVAAAVWLLVALGVLYLSDQYKAGRVNDLLSEGALDEQHLTQLDKQIEVARYLELSGPIPLAIMDEVGQKIEGYMFEDFSYERGGTVRIGGTRKTADQIGKLTEDLAGMDTLDAVQLQSQANAGKMIRFEIVATVSPKFFGAFVQPPPEEAPENEGEEVKKKNNKGEGE